MREVLFIECLLKLTKFAAVKMLSTKVMIASNAHSDENSGRLLNLFRLAHFLFTNEIPHKTNWRSLVSAAAALASAIRFARN
jgi:hypothetical protein